MPTYKYKYSVNGEEREETNPFSDKAALYAAVRAESGTIISAEEVADKKAGFKFFSFRKKIKQEEQISFAKNMSVMIDAGLSISRAISVLKKQSKSKNFINLMEAIPSSVNAGETFSKSLESRPDVFSSLFVSMVRAGEESGKLSQSLKIISEQLEKSFLLSKKIKGAMIYPAVIISIMLVIGVVLMVYMVPTLTETFKGLNIELPLPTRIIIAVSDFLRYNIFLTFVSIAALFAGAGFFARSVVGKRFIDSVAISLPMINTMVKEVNAARTARTLSSLISSGVPIVSAIETTKNVIQNHHFQDILAEAGQKVQVGELLSASITSSKKDLYPVFLSEMLAVGEETGKMSAMLDNIAIYYESEVDQKTKDLSTIIEPFLMVLIGIAVGIFAIAVMLPTYSLVDAIQ